MSDDHEQPVWPVSQVVWLVPVNAEQFAESHVHPVAASHAPWFPLKSVQLLPAFHEQPETAVHAPWVP